MLTINTYKKLLSQYIARLLAHVLANKPFTFLQPLIIIYTHIILLCKNFIDYCTFVSENIRINTVFFSRPRERLEGVNSASTFDASTINKIKRQNQKTKKVPVEMVVSV